MKRKLTAGLAAFAIGVLALAVPASAAPPPPSVTLVVMNGHYQVAAGEDLSATTPAVADVTAVNKPAHDAVVLCASGFERELIATPTNTITNVRLLPFPKPAPGHTITETVTAYVTAVMPPRSAACHLTGVVAKASPFTITWYTPVPPGAELYAIVNNQLVRSGVSLPLGTQVRVIVLRRGEPTPDLLWACGRNEKGDAVAYWGADGTFGFPFTEPQHPEVAFVAPTFTVSFFAFLGPRKLISPSCPLPQRQVEGHIAGPFVITWS
jgi:hypothetical protein